MLHVQQQTKKVNPIKIPFNSNTQNTLKLVNESLPVAYFESSPDIFPISYIGDHLYRNIPTVNLNKNIIKWYYIL